VEDAVDAGEVERVLGEVEAADVERQISKQPCVLLLQRDVVVVGEAVDPGDLVAARGERLREVRADETGGSRHHVAAHRSTIP
jgi:hypothetical protein